MKALIFIAGIACVLCIVYAPFVMSSKLSEYEKRREREKNKDERGDGLE